MGQSFGPFEADQVLMSDDTMSDEALLFENAAGPEHAILFDNTVEPSAEDVVGLTPDELQHVLELYFENVSPFVQFIHRSTFDSRTAFRPLVLGMACLGAQYAPVDKPCGVWFKEASVLLDSHDIQQGSPLFLPKIQALVLLELYAIMYACGNQTIEGLRMHSKSVEVGSARVTVAHVRWLDRRGFSTLCQPDQRSPLIWKHYGWTM